MHPDILSTKLTQIILEFMFMDFNSFTKVSGHWLIKCFNPAALMFQMPMTRQKNEFTSASIYPLKTKTYIYFGY